MTKNNELVKNDRLIQIGTSKDWALNYKNNIDSTISNNFDKNDKTLCFWFKEGSDCFDLILTIKSINKLKKLYTYEEAIAQQGLTKNEYESLYYFYNENRRFNKKIQQLQKSGFIFSNIDYQDYIITIDLEKSNLFIKNYQSKALTNSGKFIECNVYTYNELIDKEAETIFSCSMAEFESTLFDKYKDVNSLKILKMFIPDDAMQMKLAKIIAKQEIDNRYLTKYNCLTNGDSESFNGLYLSPL